MVLQDRAQKDPPYTPTDLQWRQARPGSGTIGTTAGLMPQKENADG